MDQFRQAKCTAPACAATFKVPGTFTANKAKCPKCGGVVEVGPVQSSAPKADAAKADALKAESATPAAKPVPAAVPAPKPAAPKAAAPAPKPAAAAKPAAAKPAAAAPAKPAAAAAKPAAPSVRDAAASAASKVKSGATTPAASKSKKGADEGESEGKRPRHVHKEKSKTPMILGAVFCLGMVGAAGWWFGVKMPAEEQAKQEAADALAKQKREAAEAQAAKDKAEMEAADAARLASAAAAEQQKNGGAAPAATNETPAEKPAEKPTEKPATPKATDSSVVDDIDLTAFPVLPKQSSCSDEQWASLQDDARTLIDPAAGAKGGRAGKRLQEAGRLAVPALLNQFRTINPATDDGRKAGDLIQKTLERICNGRNFGWQYTTEPKDVVYNKKAIKNWFKIWETVGEDEQQWLGFTKQLQKEGEAAKPAEGEGKAASGLDDF